MPFFPDCHDDENLAVKIAKQGIREYGRALEELAALEALDKLYDQNGEGMKRLANE